MVKRGRRSNDGTGFQDEMNASWLYLKETEAPTLVPRRIHDTKDFLKAHAHIILPNHAADYYILYNGTFVQYEYKSSISKTSFILKRYNKKKRRDEPTIKEHQYREAFAARAAKCGSWFIINKRVAHHNEAYLMHPTVMWELQDAVFKTGKKSVKWEVLRKSATLELEIINKRKLKNKPKGQGKLWDLRCLLDNLV